MTEVRWLDDEEQKTWRALLAATRQLRHDVFAPVQAAAGLSRIDYAVLVHLSEQPDQQARMVTLGEVADASSSQLVYRIDRLVELGYIERRPCPTDRRGRLAALTPEGLHKLEQAAPVHVAAVRKVFIDRLTRDEMLTLGEVLGRVLAEPPPPRT